MKVMLPKSLEVEIHEQVEGRLDAMGIEPTDKRYKKLYKAVFTEKCEEAYFHSMTPAGSLRSNPTTPKVPKDIIEQFYLTSMQGFLKDYAVNSDNGQKKFLQSQFRGALSSLTNLLLRLKYGFKVKKGDSEASDFEYKPMRGQDSSVSREMMKQVQVNRYFRYLVLSMLTAHVEKFFKSSAMSKANLQSMMEEYFGNEGDLKEQLKKLQSKAVQKDFAKFFYDKVGSGEIKI